MQKFDLVIMILKIKKKLIIFFSIILLIGLTSCNGMQEKMEDKVSFNEKAEFNNQNSLMLSNEILPIYDINNMKIGEINHYGTIMQTNDSIIYLRIPTQTTNTITEIDYYRYIISTKQNIKIGTIKSWVFQSSEVVLINNHLYFFVITGDISDKQRRTLKLMDLDLINNSLIEVFSEKGGFPYNSMTAVNDKLLVAKVLDNGSCVDEYDTVTKQFKTLIKFDFDDKTAIGETIRQISYYKNTISLIMLVKETSTAVKLRIDTYDHHMNFINSYDVTTISEDDNELKQGISNFEFFNEYIYYENFSLTRVFGKVRKNKIDRRLDTNQTFSMVTEAVNNDTTKLFYQSFTQNDNSIYLCDTKSGKVRKASLNVTDSRYYIINMSRDINDNILAVMYYKDPQTGEKLSPYLYYINLSELTFE